VTAPGDEAEALLIGLVRTPSPSGQEAAAAAVLARFARERGLSVTVDDAAVRIEVAGREPGPTLLLASHLDTVPPGEGWEVDPCAGVVEDGILHGRGAVDAKASVAAMACAARLLAGEGGPARGRLVVMATYCEETRDTTMPLALKRLGGLPDAALIGEPTSLEPCVGQRGLLVLRLSWHGEQRHAGRAGAPAGNAIHRAARGLCALSELQPERIHPLLGGVSVTPTEIQAGVARNVTPPTCSVVLDIRSTPAYSHEELRDLVAGAVGGEVEVLSDRLRPAETPPDSALLRAVRAARPAARPFGSPTTSDWVFLSEADTVKLGPGDSRLSHTKAERIELAEVTRGARLYADVAREYLALRPPTGAGR
jgi:acetylornithine deacetylase